MRFSIFHAPVALHELEFIEEEKIILRNSVLRSYFRIIEIFELKILHKLARCIKMCDYRLGLYRFLFLERNGKKEEGGY